jgi:hypothetical protein
MLMAKMLAQIAEQMESFEAAASVSGSPTGSRRDGGYFEALCLDFWEALADICKEKKATVVGATCVGGRHWQGLRNGDRILWLPSKHPLSSVDSSRAAEWLKTNYDVTELVSRYPGNERAVQDFAPASGPFSGQRYPKIYENLKTGFDGAIIFVRANTLERKMLLEYKTAKSSLGGQIDGNAHERLSFEIMQFLEVATRYPSASLRVLANGAFVRYRNKYHVNFKIQAQRLRCFGWFDMKFMCTALEFLALAEECESWLFAKEGYE